MFLHVLEARYVRDYVVWLKFSDGAEGEVDLSSELVGPVFGPLHDMERFKDFSVAYHTLTWSNGADFRARVSPRTDTRHRLRQALEMPVWRGFRAVRPD